MTIQNVQATPADIDAILKAQALAILNALHRWGEAHSGCRVSVEHGPEGWRATLDDYVAGGDSLIDALAQVAQAANLEDDT
ncbi:MAG TPA: hypothetical protein VK571_09165 [Gemmatimonadaceae bacterium]|nr:hypothetical protein [Gemmatimonadaceae bacterium]